METYSVGIVGMGYIGFRVDDSHWNAYRDCPHTEVVAVCDTILPFIPQLTVPIYSNYNEMLSTHTLDIISVCTPAHTHANIVIDLADRTKALYVEKPMASTLEECAQMIQACAAYGTILQINHQRRFVKPLFRFSRDLIDTGTHAFDWLRQHGIDADIEYVPTMEKHIFELVITRERMILAGVEHLVWCLDNHKNSKSSGEDGYFALKAALEFKEKYEGGL